MADTAQLILSKYYGFGTVPENNKFLSSHDGTYDPKKYDSKSYTNDPSSSETTEVDADQSSGLQIAKEEKENLNSGDSTVNAIVRSSRAIPYDVSFEDEDDDSNVYEASVELANCPNDRRTSVENEITEEKYPTPKSEVNNEPYEGIRNDSTLGHFDDVISDDISDISSIPTRKKSEKSDRKKCILAPTSPKISSQPSSVPKKIPSCSGDFLDLTDLSLDEFPVNMLPDLSNLRMLYLDNNSLTIIPEELFSGLKVLQWLDVRNNKLTTLPKNIKHHNCLETILLEGNLFEKLPLELCLIPKLKDLQTSRNPLVFPSADILSLGFGATMNCLRNEWNKLNPEEAVETPQKEKKPKSSTILCSEPPLVRKISKSSRIFGSSSTGRVDEGAKNISVRMKSNNYRPSNRCKNRGADEQTEARLLWIAKVKEMLTEQAAILQRIKDRDALSNWRRDRRSYEKSMTRAANRSADDIPFGIDVKDFATIMKNKSKTRLATKWRKGATEAPRNINEKMCQLYESINRLQRARESDNMSPRTEQKLLENEIKKLTEVQEEIQNLRRYNEKTTEAFENSKLLPQTKPYKLPPSIIL